MATSPHQHSVIFGLNRASNDSVDRRELKVLSMDDWRPVGRYCGDGIADAQGRAAPMASDSGRFQHPCFARCYQRISRVVDRNGGAQDRVRLLAGLTGRVVEIGAGNGLNFPHYPTGVQEVIAVEPEDHLRALAERAAAAAPVPIRVVAGHAEALPVEDGSTDAAVFSLVLCSVSDPVAALAEAHRVLHPGGSLRFFEHVRSPHRLVGTVQDLLAPMTTALLGGCRFNRDTGATIRDSDFVVDDLVTLHLGGVSHILGQAHHA
ncbi:MAG TPA: class I SAM-dependent methyltransferase [Pseudonocardiaceae bacterium]